MTTYTVYTGTNCKWCHAALDLLADKAPDATIEIRNAGTSDEHLEFLVSKGLKTVPQIWRDGEYIGGYTDLAAKLN